MTSAFNSDHMLSYHSRSSESPNARSRQSSQSSTSRESSAVSESASQSLPNNPVVQSNAITPSPNVHTLRSSTTYVHNDNIVPRTNSLKTALYNAFHYFQSGSPIPTSLLAKLDSFAVDSDTFLRMTRVKELNGGRYIYLEDGKIKFFTFTQPPHAEVIGRVLRQISRQDTADLFIDGSGGGILFFIFLLNPSRCPTW
jgi:hypothetical protein